MVENRPGGDGLVAINAFISANDDHTLLFVPASTFTAHPYTHDKLPYDSERDLLPIVNVTTIVIALGAPESLNVKSLAEFVALARAKPDTLTWRPPPAIPTLILTGFHQDAEPAGRQGAVSRHPCRRRTTLPRAHPAR